MTEKILLPNTKVKVKRCRGTALVVKYIRRHDIYLLDRQMYVEFQNPDVGNVVLVPFWTFARDALEVVT